MIDLLTGQPGHGKTLRAIELAVAAKAEHREVFVCRIRGIDLEKTGFKELASLSEWQSCPDGSFIVVDECYEDIPARAAGRQPPEWEQALATHRHRGFDFVLICQQGSQISTFVRGLVNLHTHVRRKFGFAVSNLLQWDRYCAAVSSDSEIKGARSKKWKYPKHLYDLYKSAEVHTVKRSLPWQVFAIPLLVLLIGGCIWSVFHRFGARGKVDDAGKDKDGKPVVVAKADAPKKPQTAEEYLRSLNPLVPGMPWSAPIFAGRKVVSVPEIYCVDLPDQGRCQCYTEQVTKLNVEPVQCAKMAKDGVYNPFREPQRSQVYRAFPSGQRGEVDIAMEGQQPTNARAAGNGFFPVRELGQADASSSSTGSRGGSHHPLTEPYHPEVFQPNTSQY